MWRRLRAVVVVGLCLAVSVAGCSMPALPEVPGLPNLREFTDIPGLPRELSDIPGVLQDLGLGDLANLENLPGLEALPFLQTRPGALVLRGPIERRVQVGERLPGTDIVLRGLDDEGAEFEIAGMRSVRTYGDSLDFDGDWPGVAGVNYNLRLRVYQIGRESVRAAGVHQLEILDVSPVAGELPSRSGGEPAELTFPTTWSVARGEIIPGTTFHYVGTHERGGEIGGLAQGDYPYHKTGDSIRWRGRLRPEISADYHLRMLNYGEDSARVGGLVTVLLPGE